MPVEIAPRVGQKPVTKEILGVKVSKQKFDSLLSRLINAEPQKRSETKPTKKRRTKKAARKA